MQQALDGDPKNQETETLYVTTPDSYLFCRNENICVKIGGEEKASVKNISSPLAEGRELKFCKLLDERHMVGSPLAEGRELK